jgi:hypothetical protein
MKNRFKILLAFTALVTLSFTSSSVEEKKIPVQQEVKVYNNEPVGGLVIEDKL